MYKVVQSNAVNAGFGLTPEKGSSRISPTLLLEKNSADRAGQLDWTASLDRVDPRVVEWLKKQSLDFDRYVYCMVVPLGADESWEQTTNGDSFKREMLAPENPDWGHKSFEHHANAFRNHRNSNPELGFGDVPFTVFNDQMDRVEGVWRLDRERAQKVGALDAVERIAKNGAAEISMGCRVPYDVCFRALTPVFSARGYVSIEDLRVGDDVLTHEGNFRPVTRLLRREFSGNMVTLVVAGIERELECTDNHPVLVLRRDDVYSCRSHSAKKPRPHVRTNPDGRARRHTYVDGQCKWCGESPPELQWVPAKDVQDGDFVAVPRTPHASAAIRGEAWAYLTGLYLGDGSLIKQGRGRDKQGEKYLQGVSLSFDSEGGEWVRAVDTLAGAVEGPVNYFDGGKGRKAVTVTVFDRGFAEWAEEYCGAGAYSKVLPSECLTWSLSEKLALLAGLLDSDGSVDEKKGSSRISMHAEGVIQTAQLLAASLGMSSAVHAEVVSTEWSPEPTDLFVLHLGAEETAKLRDWSSRAAGCVPPTRTRKVSMVLDGYVLHRVEDVFEEPVADLPVYNISVAGDETYVVSNLAVHNCSYCGNKAKNVKQYCSHVRNPGFGAINAVGELMRVFNPWPKFFDLSDVRVPAAPEAHVLMMISPQLAASIQTKTSSGARFIVPSAVLGAERYGTTAGGVLMPQHYKASSAAEAVKLSDIVKRAPVLEAQVIRPLQDTEGELTDEKIKNSGVEGLPLPSVLSTMASLGIVCSPEEICRIIEASTGERHKVPATLEIKQAWDSVTDSHPHIASGFYSPVIADKLRGMVPDRSVFYPHLPERIASYDYGNVHERIEVGAGSKATGRDFRISVEIESDGPMNPIARYIASYLKTLSVKLGKLLAEVSAAYPSHQSHCLGAGLLTGPPSTKNPIDVGDHTAAVAFPSAYILSRAGKGADGEEMQRSIDSLHYPGIEHLFGGLLHD